MQGVVQRIHRAGGGGIEAQQRHAHLHGHRRLADRGDGAVLQGPAAARHPQQLQPRLVVGIERAGDAGAGPIGGLPVAGGVGRQQRAQLAGTADRQIAAAGIGPVGPAHAGGIAGFHIERLARLERGGAGGGAGIGVELVAAGEHQIGPQEAAITALEQALFQGRQLVCHQALRWGAAGLAIDGAHLKHRTQPIRGDDGLDRVRHVQLGIGAGVEHIPTRGGQQHLAAARRPRAPRHRGTGDLEAFAGHLGRELQGGGASWIKGHREVAGAGGGEGLALQEQRQSPGDLLAVAVHRGVGECRGVAAIGTGHIQLDLIAGLEGALQLQLADLGHAGIAGTGQNTEGHPGHQALKQQGVGRGGVDAGLEEGTNTAADGLAGIEPSHQLLHRLLLDLGLVAAEAREGEREHLGIAAAGAVEQSEVDGVAIAVGAQQLQGCGLGHGADRRRADGGIGREGEGSGAAQFAAEQMHPAGPQG